MKLEHEFTVVAPIDQTWDALIDVERVGRCLPGATVTPAVEEGVYDGQMKLKLGPMTVAYKGTLRMVEVDEVAHRAVMQIQAKELKGHGAATARMENRLTLDGHERTRVLVGTELEVSGRAAQLGRGMMESVADRLLGDFAKRLECELAAAGDGDAGEASPAGERAPSGNSALGAVPEGAAPDRVDDALDLGGAASATLVRKEGVIALVVMVAGGALLLFAARHRRVQVLLRFHSGWRGRGVELQFGK